MVFQFCRPVWRRWIDLAGLSGTAPAAAGDPPVGADWLPPRWDWVDPMKDIRAEVEAIDAGLKSRSQAIAERGYDAEQVDAEIAADHAREQRLGIGFGAVRTEPGSAVMTDPADQTD